MKSSQATFPRNCFCFTFLFPPKRSRGVQKLMEGGDFCFTLIDIATKRGNEAHSEDMREVMRTKFQNLCGPSLSLDICEGR